MNIKNEFGFINLWIVNITINNFLITVKYFYTLLQILLNWCLKLLQNSISLRFFAQS